MRTVVVISRDREALHGLDEDSAKDDDDSYLYILTRFFYDRMHKIQPVNTFHGRYSIEEVYAPIHSVVIFH